MWKRFVCPEMLSAKTIGVDLLLIFVFGVIIPWRKGIEFLDPTMISAYCCLGVLLAGPYASSIFAASRPQTMRELFRRAAGAVAYGEGMTLVILVSGVLTVSIARRNGLHLLLIDVLAREFLFGLAATIALCFFAAWVTLRFSLVTARRSMRLIFFFAVFAFFYWPTRLPEISLQGAAIAILLAASTLLLLRREVAPQ